MVAEEAAEVAAGVAGLAVVALAVVVDLRELVVGVVDREELPSQGLRGAMVATITVHVLELLGVLLNADVEAGERILSVVLAQIFVVAGPSEYLMLIALDSSGQRARLHHWHPGGFVRTHQVHLADVAHLVFALARTLTTVHGILPEDELRRRGEAALTEVMLAAV